MIYAIGLIILASCDPALDARSSRRRTRTWDATRCAPRASRLQARSTAAPIEALEALDAFGAAGTYDRPALARLYGGTRVQVARGWTTTGGRFESITLLSPYPDRVADPPAAGDAGDPLRRMRRFGDTARSILSDTRHDLQDRAAHGMAVVVCAARRRHGPDAAVGADRAGRRPRHGRRRRLGSVRLRGSRLLQLHRLRALRAAAVPRRCDGRGQGRPAFHAARRDPHRESRHRPPVRPLPAHPAVDERAISTSRSGACRRPSAPSRAGPTPTTTRSSATRSRTSTSPRMRPDAVPGERRRIARASAAAAGCVRYIDRQPDVRAPACRSSARSAGTPASRCTRTTGMLSATAAVTAGTVSNPLFSDDNQRPPDRRTRRAAPGGRPDPRHVAARAGRSSATAAARAAVGDGHDARVHADRVGRRRRVLARSLPAPVRDDRQPTGGCRSAVPPPNQRRCETPLSAVSTSVEGRYKLRPDFYVAARFDHLGFSEVTGTTGTQPWDAPVTRIEVGGGYSIQRNLLLKVSYPARRPRRRPRC